VNAGYADTDFGADDVDSICRSRGHDIESSARACMCGWGFWWGGLRRGCDGVGRKKPWGKTVLPQKLHSESGVSSESVWSMPLVRMILAG
jgi:hypothetical protein